MIAAERQAVCVRPRVCASRTFDREREGMGGHVGRRYQPQLVLRLAQFGDEGTGAPLAYVSANCLSNAPGLKPAE